MARDHVHDSLGQSAVTLAVARIIVDTSANALITVLLPGLGVVPVELVDSTGVGEDDKDGYAEEVHYVHDHAPE